VGVAADCWSGAARAASSLPGTGYLRPISVRPRHHPHPSLAPTKPHCDAVPFPPTSKGRHLCQDADFLTCRFPLILPLYLYQSLSPNTINPLELLPVSPPQTLREPSGDTRPTPQLRPPHSAAPSGDAMHAASGAGPCGTAAWPWTTRPTPTQLLRRRPLLPVRQARSAEGLRLGQLQRRRLGERRGVWEGRFGRKPPRGPDPLSPAALLLPPQRQPSPPSAAGGLGSCWRGECIRRGKAGCMANCF
jgi:hypothetical protein